MKNDSVQQKRRVVPALVLAVAAGLAGAGAPAAATAGTEFAAPRARAADIAFRKATPGVTPFISFAKFTGGALASVTGVSYWIAQAAGAHAKPVQVSYSMPWLIAHGRVTKDGAVTLPVFGLYAGATNDVTVTFDFKDGSSQDLQIAIATATWVDPRGIYDHPVVVTPRNPRIPLGYSYIYVKSSLGTPVVLDTDAQVRWVGTGIDDSFSSAFVDNGFMIGSHDGPLVIRLELDGSFTWSPVVSPTIEHFNHNIAPGRDAMLTGVDTLVNGIENIQSTIVEMTDTAQILRTWDFAQIIGDYMSANGDDPALFVRPGENWLHLNSQIYDPSDDTLIVSSREQFVMKIGYTTNDIRWIFGSPDKYWYTFPSLRAKAITMMRKGAFYPIGQHSISLATDGQLMLFDNGAPSSNVPPGAPHGKGRPYSVVSTYTINAGKMTASETLRYTHDKTLRSAVCSSAAQADSDTLLVDYAAADDDTHAHLIGLGASGTLAFEYQYTTHDCGTAWNVQPIPFESLVFE
jgi:hypothetical protein